MPVLASDIVTQLHPQPAYAYGYEGPQLHLPYVGHEAGSKKIFGKNVNIANIVIVALTRNPLE